MKFLSRLFGREPKPGQPQMQLQPQPIAVNPSNPAQLKRHVGRLANLYNAQGREPDRADIPLEIERYKNAIAAFGHPAPSDEQAARELLARLGS